MFWDGTPGPGAQHGMLAAEVIGNKDIRHVISICFLVSANPQSFIYVEAIRMRFLRFFAISNKMDQCIGNVQKESCHLKLAQNSRFFANF